MKRASLALLLGTISLLVAPRLSGEEPRLIIDEASFRPWRFVGASIEATEGLPGAFRIVGITWDSETRVLFESRGSAWAATIDAPFFLDESIRSLRLERSAGRGVWEGLDDIEVPPEAAALSPPDPPFHAPAFGVIPRDLELGQGNLADIARIATEKLFVDTRPWPALALLTGLSLLFALAVLPAPARLLSSWPGTALALILVGLAVSAALLTLPPSAQLRSLALPSSQGEKRVSGRVELRESGETGFPSLAWGLRGDALLFGVRTTADRPLPFPALVRKDASYRFNPPPLVISDRGLLYLSFSRYAVGWRILDAP
jgi:hypothetical protein